MRAEFILIGRIADHRGIGADHKEHLVPKLLELAQLAHGNGMPKMEIRGGGVITAINTQRFAGFFGFDQAFAQLCRHIVGNRRVAKISALH